MVRRSIHVPPRGISLAKLSRRSAGEAKEKSLFPSPQQVDGCAVIVRTISGRASCYLLLTA